MQNKALTAEAHLPALPTGRQVAGRELAKGFGSQRQPFLCALCGSAVNLGKLDHRSLQYFL